jgi:peptidoglycan/LPS O-acetylase OafA/YrhL
MNNVKKVLTRDRRVDIDFLRFYAITLVTSFHIARWLGYDNLSWLNPLKLVFIEGAGIGVYMFFLLSGYCLAMKYDYTMSYGRFLWTRLLRIVPAYWVSIAIWCMLVSAGVTSASIQIKDVLFHMFFIHVFFSDTFFSVSGVFWFLGDMMQLYLLFPVLFWICRRWFLGVVFAVVPFGITLLLVKKCGFLYPGFAKSSLMYMTPYIAGILFCMYPVRIRCQGIRFLLLGLSIALFFWKIPWLYGEVARQTKTILFAFAILQFKDGLALMPCSVAKVVNMIAASSFSIYLYNYIFHVGRVGARNGLVMLCYLGMVFGFGVMMHNLIERPLNSLVKMILMRYARTKIS